MAVDRIRVTLLDENRFRVTVSDAGGRTEHTVTVAPADYQRLSGGAVTPEELVRRSFEFLLEREPKEAILQTFALSVISRYFAEYETDIARRIRGR